MCARTHARTHACTRVHGQTGSLVTVPQMPSTFGLGLSPAFTLATVSHLSLPPPSAGTVHLHGCVQLFMWCCGLNSGPHAGMQALIGLDALQDTRLSFILCPLKPNEQDFNLHLSFYQVRVSEPQFPLLLHGEG